MKSMEIHIIKFRSVNITMRYFQVPLLSLLLMKYTDQDIPVI